MTARTWNQKLNNWENDYTYYVDEEYGCKKGAPQIEGRTWEGKSSHGSVCIIEGNDQNQNKVGGLVKEE